MLCYTGPAFIMIKYPIFRPKSAGKQRVPLSHPLVLLPGHRGGHQRCPLLRLLHTLSPVNLKTRWITIMIGRVKWSDKTQILISQHLSEQHVFFVTNPGSSFAIFVILAKLPINGV